jgi:thioredoxin 1
MKIIIKLGEICMINEPLHVTDDAFEKTVIQSEVPVVVDFWAPWCGPCRMVAPILDKLAKEYAGKMLIAKVNTDENPEWAQKYNVQGIPTMLFVADGKVVHQQVGALPEPMLRSVVDQFLNVVNEN